MNENSNKSYDQIFTKKIIRYGLITNTVAAIACFLPSIVIWLVYDTIPTFNQIFNGWMLVVATFGAYYFIEPISYFPILGIPGTYMSFLAGNIGNMRVPCAAVAQSVLKADPGTEKGELVATLGIAGSIVVNIVVVTIAAFGGAALMKIFPKPVLDAFVYVAPAIFGAMFGMFANKALKYGAFAITVALVMLFTNAYTGTAVFKPYIMIPVSVFATVGFAIFDSKRKEAKQ